MGDAIGLFLFTPPTYFHAIANPFAAGALSLISAAGTVCLIIGIAIGIMRRNTGLCLFLIPLGISQSLIVVAGLQPGQVPDGGDNIIYPFMLVQGLLSGYLVFHQRRTFIAAVTLAAFTVSYAFWASFLATMFFRNIWL